MHEDIRNGVSYNILVGYYHLGLRDAPSYLLVYNVDVAQCTLLQFNTLTVKRTFLFI
jgi:hypothetical protein